MGYRYSIVCDKPSRVTNDWDGNLPNSNSASFLIQTPTFWYCSAAYIFISKYPVVQKKIHPEDLTEEKNTKT